MTFAERIKFIKGRLSQKAFGQKIGVSQSAVQLYEKGNIPKGDILARIHQEFQVDLHWLLTGRGAPYVTTHFEPSAKAASHETPKNTSSPLAPSPPTPEPPVHAPAEVNSSFANSVTQLLELYNTGDPALLATIEANLNAFQACANQNEEIKRQHQLISELKQENQAIKQQNAQILRRIKILEKGGREKSPDEDSEQQKFTGTAG